MDKISYADLYARWERGNWQATEIDFTADREQWHEDFSELERKAALWNYSMFFHGEDAVADDLAPFIDAAPREEQKYFLATQQVDEARHSVFFHRFMHEVVERGDGTIAGALARHRARADLGLPQDLRDARRGHRRAAQGPLAHRARARGDDVPLHRRGDARPARPALHRRLPRAPRPAARLPRGHEPRRPGRAAPHRLRRQAAARPRQARTPSRSPPRSPTCCARCSRSPSRCSCRRAATARYTECFGFTLEEIYTEGARSFESKLRMAGLPLESLPGPAGLPVRPAGRGARHARAGDAARRLPGREERRRRARPRVDGAAVRLRAPRGRPAHRARGAR